VRAGWTKFISPGTLELDRKVAVKILSAHLSDSAQTRERFDHEARAISSMSHPHICHLYDVGQHNGTSYLVLEYLQGETLADRFLKGPLPSDQVLKIAIEICEGLEKSARQRPGASRSEAKQHHAHQEWGKADGLRFGDGYTGDCRGRIVVELPGHYVRTADRGRHDRRHVIATLAILRPRRMAR
jgi:serine/threonine protein kinase